MKSIDPNADGWFDPEDHPVPGPDVFTRLRAALNIDGKRLPRATASAEEFGDEVRASAEEPEGVARLVGNGQTAPVVGRSAGSAGLNGGAPSAKKHADQ